MISIEELATGEGPEAKDGDTVGMHYRGTFPDGKQFDSSYDRNETISFGLNQVIPGWTEGVQLMKVGSKYKFYIPSALGYGDRGAGNTIGPNSPLIFEVELISIGAPAEPTAAPAAGAEAKPQAGTAKPAPATKPPAPKKPPV